MERPDWENAITTTIGILPVGSGNALCASLLYEAEYVLCVCVLCTQQYSAAHKNTCTRARVLYKA